MTFDMVITVFRIFTVFQICLVSAFLLLSPHRTSTRNLALVVFIMSKALSVADQVLISHWREVSPGALWLLCLGTRFEFLLGPSIYVIMASLVRTRVAFRPHQLLHLVPFLFAVGFMITQFQAVDTPTRITLLSTGFPWSTSWGFAGLHAIYFHFTLYGIAALRLLSRQRQELCAVSSQSFDHNLRLLKFLIYDFIVVWGTNVLAWHVPFGPKGVMILTMATAFNIFFIANTIVYQGLKFPTLFTGEPEQRGRYEKNALTEVERAGYARKITEFMLRQKPYLNPLLSLADFSQQVALPSHLVSQVLNTELRQNFYDFVNSYRIEESKRLMAAAANADATILHILYESGFNSKSVFNSAFKRYTGMTPREFRKSIPSAVDTGISSLAS